MDAIQGAGGMHSEVRPSVHVTRTGGKLRNETDGDPQEAATSGAALTLSRKYLTDALQESGFVDIAAGPVVASGQETQAGKSEQGEASGLGAALTLSRNYLTDALQEHGFVDITAGPVVASGQETQAAQSEQEEANGLGAALTLSRKYLTDALQEHGFVDICAGRASSSGREAQAGQSEQGELDVPTAAEFAAQFGEQVASCSIDRILEIVVRPDPRYTLKLLT